MALKSPSKPSRFTLPVQNGGSKINGVDSVGSLRYGSLPRGSTKPGFFVSFLVDARGGKMYGKRHSGVDLIIPPSKVCMPTRITCKLIRKEKLIHPPILKEGEALASRIAELGPVGEKFLGAVLIELPHFASRIDGERELVVLRSENGVSWHEHRPETPSDSLLKLIENEAEGANEKRVVQIFTVDFPRYFVAVTRVRQDSKTVGTAGGSVKSSSSQAVATFPERAISKDIKVGLQVLPIAPETVVRLLGQPVPMSAVTTIEPRRRKFHAPVTLSIPVSKEMQDSIRKQKKDENPAVHILYSITGGSAPSQWEDITGSAPLNLVNDAVSFSTIVSARYWLMDCRNLAIPVKAAGEVFQDAIAAPFLASFFVLAKRHSQTEAQVRVLCVTDDDIEATHERHEHFAIIGSVKDVEVFEGKPYYLDIAGNLKPVAASGQELSITFHSFRVSRLSFVARIVDVSHPPSAQLFVQKELSVPIGKRSETPLVTVEVNLPNFDAGLVSPDLEPEQWRSKLEAAKLSLAQDRPPVGAALKLTDIAEALQGDWVPLAAQLGISPREVVKIQTEFGSAPEQAILMLHLWVEKLGPRATGVELERGLRKIGRDDVIDQCIYDRQRDSSAVSDDHDSFNPIDVSFRNQEHPVSYQSTQVRKSEIQAQPFVEVDEGVEYQVEEVWDGTQWHRTRIAVQKPIDSSDVANEDLGAKGDPSSLGKVESVGDDDQKESPVPEHHEASIPLESPAPGNELLPSHESESTSVHIQAGDQVVTTSPLEGQKVVELPLENHLPETQQQLDVSGTDQHDISVQDDTFIQHDTSIQDEPPVKQEASVQDEPPVTHETSVQDEPPVKPETSIQDEPPVKHETSVQDEPPVKQETSIQDEPPVKQETSVQDEPPVKPETSVQDEPPVKPQTSLQDEPSVKQEASVQDEPKPLQDDSHHLPNDNSSSSSENPQPVILGGATESDGKNEDAVVAAAAEADRTDAKSSATISIGDPTVTTEEEEFEEVLDDGTIVKRKVIKTNQQQIVTQSFTTEGDAAALDSVADQVMHDVVMGEGFDSSQGTIVTETEETLEDGTVVVRKVTKTTERHVDTENL